MKLIVALLSFNEKMYREYTVKQITWYMVALIYVLSM